MSSARDLSPALYLTGLGSQYPPYLLGPEQLDHFAERFYDVTCPGLKKLLQINHSTGIESRSAISSYDSGFACQLSAPSINELDQFYRQEGVDLTVQACKKALQEACISPHRITHTIGVTCTNQGNPGYDILVNRELGLPAHTDRMLLHGVDCAGGLAIMRVAAQIASGASVRHKPARILAFACELCTPNIRQYLADAEQCANPDRISIAGALFSDAAAAFVLCNEYAMTEDESTPLFQVVELGNALIPDTVEYMGFYADTNGSRTVLSRDIPKSTKQAIGPMFESLLSSYQKQVLRGPASEDDNEGQELLGVYDFDWALHPGGAAIIDGAKEVLRITEEQLQSSREVYRTRGNSSSPTVLVVLDRIRSVGKRENVVATSFGPGLVIEMVMLRRC